MPYKQELTYKTEMDVRRVDRLRQLERELPAVCTDFFRSVAHTTSTLTRLAYAYDYRLFFDYLQKENPAFADAPIPLWGEKELSQITVRDIDGYQDYLSQYFDKNRSLVQNHELGIMRKLCSLRSLFEYLFRMGHVPANITTLVALPKLHEKPILRMTPEEMEKMLLSVQSGEGLTDRQQAFAQLTAKRDTAILLMFLGTGIRVSELVGIDLNDLDFSQNAFQVTRKGGNQAILYFPEQVAQALQAYLTERRQITPREGHEQALFLSLQKKRITQRAVENLVKKYALAAAPLKKRLSPHKLRSTFGTNLYQETGDIYLVADVLGHSDVNTTRRHYAAMTDQHRREAAKRIVLPGGASNEEPLPTETNDRNGAINSNGSQPSE